MQYIKQEDRKNGTLRQMALFENNSDVKEYHIILQVINPELSFTEQATRIINTYTGLLANEIAGAVPVFKRYFLSDPANQIGILSGLDVNTKSCVTSIIGQAPLNGTKVALWTCLQTNVKTQKLPSGLLEVSHSSYRHFWGSDTDNKGTDSNAQTSALFDKYIDQLKASDCNLASNCMRTWLLVDNIDANYAGVVKARNLVFDNHELTTDTHFIASTGICGGSSHPDIFVQMDTYAVDGLKPEQIQYLYAPSHLNPTHEYGVRFERGTCIKYGDRRQVFISGTASINNKGEIVYPGDVRKQTQRMWDNVETLLKEAGCEFEDMPHIIVYLRDMADYTVVKKLFDEKFPETPTIIVLGAVCRPGWLIEMECIAIKKDSNKEFDDF